MAFPLELPAGLLPSSESWVLENGDLSGGVSLTGNEKVISTGTARWRAKITYNLFPDEIMPFRGFIMGMRGRAGTVRIGPANLYGQPQPGTSDAGLLQLGLVSSGQGGPPFGSSPTGQLSSSALMSARGVFIAMVGSRKPEPGNYIEIGGGLHVVTSVIGTIPIYGCEIEPGLRFDLGAGTPVVFARPRTIMRQATPLDPGGLTVTGDTMTTNVTLDLVEAL